MTIKERSAQMGIELPPFTPPIANYVCAEGYQAARQCAINALAVLDDLCGGLDNIAHIVKVTGYINSEPDFIDQPKVLNGASDLLVELFGEAGRHARCAVGMATLGGGAACEITIDVEIKDETLAKI